MTQSWTDSPLRNWQAVDNGDGTVTFALGGSGGASSSLVIATLNGPAQELLRRLVLGNVTKDGSRSAPTTTSLTFSKTISATDSQSVRLHAQVTNTGGMSS